MARKRGKKKPSKLPRKRGGKGPGKRPGKPKAPRKPSGSTRKTRKPSVPSASARGTVPSSRAEILSALKRLSGGKGLAGRLKRAPRNSREAAYLRGLAIASAKAKKRAGKKLSRAEKALTKKRVTAVQARELLSRARPDSLEFFGPIRGFLREWRVVEAFQLAATARANKKAAALDTAWSIALFGAAKSERIFYKPKDGGATQRWTEDGFRRFMANPAYGKVRKQIIDGGTFYMAKPDAFGDLPKRGKRKLRVQ